MKYFMSALAASLIYCASAQGSATPVRDWRMCDGCSVSQMQQCAIEIASVENLKTGDYVWIFDFENWVASLYYLEVTPPGTIIQGKGDGDDSLTQSGFIAAFPQALSDKEIELSDALFGMVEVVWRPLGWGYHYPACLDSNLSSLAMGDDAKEPDATIQSEAGLIYNITIPPGPDQNSAHDIIGSQARALQLAQTYSGNIGTLGAVQSWVANFIRASPVNTQTSIRFRFADGSSAIWHYSSHNERWEPDWSTFEDSDGNPIPHTSNDVSPGMGFDFSGAAPGELNLQQFFDRMNMFGIPITGPGGGGGDGSPVRCEVTSEGLRCWYRSV